MLFSHSFSPLLVYGPWNQTGPKSRHPVASRDRRGFAAGMPPSPQPNAPEGVRTRPLTDSSSQLAERPIAARIAALGDPIPSRPTARAQPRRHSHTDYGREHSELTRRQTIRRGRGERAARGFRKHHLSRTGPRSARKLLESARVRGGERSLALERGRW